MQALTFRKGGASVRMRALTLALVFGGCLAIPVAVSAEDAGGATARLAHRETEAGALQQSVDTLSGALNAFLPPKEIAVNDVAPVQVAQARDAAGLSVRLDQLEEQMRTINGQVQGLQFQLTQMQTLLERMQEDTDARFSALEGGAAPGKTDAASQAGGATPATETPQSMDLSLPGSGGDAISGSGLGTNPNDAPIDLGAPEKPLGTLRLDDLSGTSGPEIDIGKDASLVTDADADAQYKAGYDAVIRGDYAFAEEQFRQFIALFPDHPQAPDATNWLGEALIQRGDYEEAANILLSGFQSYSNSTRAPDILMKLGIALAGTGENETACRTFNEVLRRFPDVSPAFRQRLAEEAKKASC